jgi:copper chaperone NosL
MKVRQFLKQESVACCVFRKSFSRNTPPVARKRHATRGSGRSFSLYLLLLLALIFFTTSACTSNANAGPTPPTIHYGEDLCDFCGMIINDERYAAGYVTRAGEDYVFDDIGNMFRHHLQNQAEVTAFFVHNYDDKAWIRAETASYVHSAHLTTPMLSGLAAFDSSDQAQALATEMQGQVMTFDEVLAYYKTNPMPQGEHSMEHDH